MALLQQLTGLIVLAVALLVAVGASVFSMGFVGGVWVGVFALGVAVASLQSNRKKWIELTIALAALLFSMGLCSAHPHHFLGWLSCIGISVILIAASSQIDLSPSLRLLVAVHLVFVSGLPSLSEALRLDSESELILGAAAVGITALYGVFFQFLKHSRVSYTRGLSALSHLLLRLLVLGWCAQKGAALSQIGSIHIVAEVSAWIALAVLVLSLFVKKKISWNVVCESAYSAMFFSLSLSSSPSDHIMILIAAISLSFGSLVNVGDTDESSDSKTILQFFEQGGLGSAAWLILAALSVSHAKQVGPTHHVGEVLALAAIGAKLWTGLNTNDQNVTALEKLRFVLQVGTLAVVVGILLNKSLNFI